MNQQTRRGNTPNKAQRISKEKLSQQLQEMNEQFDAIEELTQNMELDLQRSNRVSIHNGWPPENMPSYCHSLSDIIHMREYATCISYQLQSQP